MYISQYYKYEYEGIIYVSADVPEGAEILETMDILNAEEGFDLIRISDEENMGSSVWLKDDDVQENYIEIPEATPEPDEDAEE